MVSNYPWEGNITIHVDPVKKIKTSIHIRIPGWARNIAVPGGLYAFADSSSASAKLLINGKEFQYNIDKGYATIEREWKKGDIIELQLPLEIRKISSRTEVNANDGRVALQRGPLVYCVEGADNGGRAWNIILPRDISLHAEPGKILDEPVILLKGNMPAVTITDNGQNIRTEQKTVTAIPYYTWCNRGSNEMQVWLPVSISSIRIN